MITGEMKNRILKIAQPRLSEEYRQFSLEHSEVVVPHISRAMVRIVLESAIECGVVKETMPGSA